MAWVRQNYQGLIAILGALWTILSFINGKIKDPEAKSFLGKVLDAISYITRACAEGSVKLPLLQRSKSPGKVVVPNDVTPPVAAAALLPVLFLSLLVLYACAHVKSVLIDFGKCELGQVPTALDGVVSEVDKTLGDTSPNWQSDMESLGKKEGMEAINCAVAAVLHNLAAKKVALDDVGRRKSERGQIWLAAHKVAL